MSRPFHTTFRLRSCFGQLLAYSPLWYTLPMTTDLQPQPDSLALDPKLEQAAKVIAWGGTRQRAAQVADCSQRYLYYQLANNEPFQQRIAELQDGETSRLTRIARGKGGIALSLLVGIAKGHIQANPERLRAIFRLLDYSLGSPSQAGANLAAEVQGADGSIIRVMVGHRPKT